MTRADAVRAWLIRPVLLLAWAMVFWGTLLAVAVVVQALGGGSPGAWRGLLPGRDASLWVWLNLASVALAAFAWALAIATLVRLRARSREPSAD